jgi:hypothetical protein
MAVTDRRRITLDFDLRDGFQQICTVGQLYEFVQALKDAEADPDWAVTPLRSESVYAATGLLVEWDY